MKRAVWRGLGDLLPVLLGAAYASFVGELRPPFVWAVALVFAVSLSASRELIPAARATPAAVVALTASVVTGLGAVVAAWIVTALWLPVLLGVFGLLGIVLSGLFMRPGIGQSAVTAGIDLLVRVLVLPMMAVLLAGGTGSFSWWITVALIPGAAAYGLCDVLSVISGEEGGPGRNWAVPISLFLLAAGGVVSAAGLLPGIPEIRLLATGASVILVATTLGALLHPSPHRRLAMVCLLVRLTHLSVLAGFGLVYLMS